MRSLILMVTLSFAVLPSGLKSPALSAAEQPVGPVGQSAWDGVAEREPGFKWDGLMTLSGPRGGVRSGAPAMYPLFAWPLVNALNDGVVIINYVDDDPTTGIKDYEGLPHAYDTHQGTDISLLSFRSMDRGVPVIAASPGTVILVNYHYPDRNTIPGPPDSVNLVVILHADGSAAGYIHLRKNSTTVKLGELVQTGDTVGYVASSGSSNIAHLHFEVRDSTQVNWRDPWQGANQPLPSLWLSQEPYVGTAPLRIFEMDVFTESAAGGNIASIPFPLILERLSAPAVFGASEPYVGVWLSEQGPALDSLTVIIRRPDASAFNSVNYTFPSKSRFGYRWWYWNFSGNVSPADYGTWTAEVRIAGIVVQQRSFEVGAATEYGPRFWPLAGRSLRYAGSPLEDTLRVSSLGGPVTYSLLNAPGYVSLNEDSIVEMGTPCSMTSRSDYFQAVATDGANRADTMWYHLVDESRPACYADLEGDGLGDPADPGTPSTGDPCPGGSAANNCDRCLAFASPGNVFISTGDVNLSGNITSADIIFGVNYVFKSGSPPMPCAAAADVNCSGTVTSSDLIYWVNHVFKGGPPPCSVCDLAPGASTLCP